jgi:3D (Asp-Asp-Asp) domain-containing protein
VYGEDGILEKTYLVTTGSRHETEYHYISERVIKAPIDMQVLAGYTDRASRVLPSRSGVYNRSEELDLIATGYAPSEGPGHGICKTGMRAGYGVVAVDPRLIPLRSKLYISGYGFAIAGDTGGAIKGHRIDLGQNTLRAASDVGRRHVHVYVLESP